MADPKELGRLGKGLIDKGKTTPRDTRPQDGTDYDALCEKVLADFPNVLKRLAE